MAGIIDQNVNPAKFSDGFLNHVFHLLHPGNISGSDKAPPPHLPDVPGYHLEVSLGAGGGDDICSRLSQGKRNRPANAPARPGNDSHFTFKTEFLKKHIKSPFHL
jgi:hypothetical protein